MGTPPTLSPVTEAHRPLAAGRSGDGRELRSPRSAAPTCGPCAPVTGEH